MNPDDIEYQKMVEEHLHKLTSFGRLYLMELSGCIDVLKHYYADELDLPPIKEHEIFDILVERQRKFIELIEWSISERQKHINKLQSNLPNSSESEID